MTDQVVNAELSESLPPELTDEQVDKFFETQGKDITNDPDVTSQSEGETQLDTTSEVSQDLTNQGQDNLQNETVEEEKHARNYQAAMKEERARRQELQAKLEETRIQQARMEERFQKLFDIKQQQEQPQIPSFDEDPLGHQQHAIKELSQYVIEQNQYLKQQENARHLMDQRRQFEQSYMTQAQEFSKSTPDFMEAYNYLVNKKMSEYMAAGLSQQQANQQLTYEEAQIVSLAFNQGVNPAERVYAMAKASGYSRENTQQLQAQNSDNNSEVTKKLEQIQKSLAANKSLSQTGGKTDTRPALSLQSIADMDDDEFDKVDWNKVIKAA